MDLGGQRFAVDHLVNYVETATALGFEAVSANDHVVFGAPWLDGPTALAAVVSCSGSAKLFTTVANPVVRGPAALAKVLAGLDVMSGGRVVAALGPGSSDRDYASVGVPFEERWPRFDEAVSAMRSLLTGESWEGAFYAVEGPLEPLPAQPNGIPLWVGSWGSEAGLGRAVRLGDGWLGSAYNITPPQFRERWDRAQELLGEAGRDPASFTNGIATMWFHIDDRRADEVLEKRLAPAVHRPIEQLRERLAFGSAEAVLEKVSAFRDAGAQWLFLWPVADDIEQLRRFSDGVMAPMQASARRRGQTNV
jgi:alkanesulfonate monooxygenase SsuD/methylene tetrahydromethanopterin reductase-like flavin-dependent oxidoreductase (luciferase family)